MKRIASLIFIASSLAVALSACNDSNDEPQSPTIDPSEQAKWNLVWQDDFNSPTINEQYWSKTDRGTSDWNNNLSHNDDCFGWRDGCLLLKGIVNPDTESDPQTYICGGIKTSNKVAFGPSESDSSPVSIQVKARLGDGATGAWPAIWMMPFESGKPWPACGEIDIMERLNHEKQIYQTVHSAAGSFSKTSYFDPTQFHVFEVQLWPDEVKYYLDHQLTYTYKKEASANPEVQFPYFKQWYLIIDMQLGGSWVGEVDGSQLPVEMEVDWVKYYRFK